MLISLALQRSRTSPGRSDRKSTIASRNQTIGGIDGTTMLSVAIAMEPPTESAAVVQAVARSCEQAIGEGRCQPASELRAAEVVTWFALIRAAEPEPTTV